MKTKHLLRKLLTLQEINDFSDEYSTRIPDSIKLSELIDIIKDIKEENKYICDCGEGCNILTECGTFWNGDEISKKTFKSLTGNERMYFNKNK